MIRFLVRLAVGLLVLCAAVYGVGMTMPESTRREAAYS